MKVTVQAVTFIMEENGNGINIVLQILQVFRAGHIDFNIGEYWSNYFRINSSIYVSCR